jgi:hypothetical protein
LKPQKRQALGLIETWGYLPLTTAVDGAVKAAQVSLASCRLVGGGLASAALRGDVGAVKAAMAAAMAIIAGLGARGVTHIIARPADAVWDMLENDGLNAPKPGEPPEGEPPESGGRPDDAKAPALKSSAGLPVARAVAEAPAVKAAAAVPAARPETAPPAAREKTALPVKRAAAPAPKVREEDLAPAAQSEKPAKAEVAVKPTVKPAAPKKTAQKTKKTRKK